MIEQSRICKKKILIIGPCPPPYGGVSVHIYRFCNLLKNDFCFDFIDESPLRKKEYFNLRTLQLYKYLKKISNADVLYVHSGNNLLRIFHLLIGKFFLKKIILVLHGFTSNPPKVIFYINGILYRLANTIIVVNIDIKERLFLPEKKCVIKEAFIPPSIHEEPELPQNITEFLLKNRKDGKIIVCANAFRLEKYKNQDLYGLDMCIEVAKRLLEKKITFIFIFVVSTIDQNADIYFKNETLIRDLNLSENFFLTNQNLSFVKLMEESDIVVRPTNTDGDSLTIREALFLNKEVLASDVIKRPVGVHLFQNRDFNDLEKKLKSLITNIEAGSGENASHAKNNIQSSEEFKKFYSRLIERT